MVDLHAVERFLAGSRIAVVGVGAPESKSFGRTVFDAFADAGYEAVPVGRVAGTYPSLQAAVSAGGALDGAVVMVPAASAVSVVADAVDAGVRRLWLFRGLGGPGAVSDEVVGACEAAGVEVVAGACPFMFLEPVRGVHRFHRWVRRCRGAFRGSPTPAR